MEQLLANIFEILKSINYSHYLELFIYLILFIIALRAIHFLSIKQDPIKSLKIKQKHWFAKQKEAEDLRKEIEGKG